MLMRSGAPLNVESPAYPVRMPVMGGGPISPPVSGPGLPLRGTELVTVTPTRTVAPATPGITKLGLPVAANSPSGYTPSGCTTCDARAQSAANFIVANSTLFLVGLVIVLFFVLRD